MSEFEEILKMTGIVSVPTLWITIANVIVLLCNVVIFVAKKIKAAKSNKDIESQNKNINMDTEDLEVTATELKQLAGGHPIEPTSECFGYCYSAATGDNNNEEINTTRCVPFLQAMEDKERSSIRKAIIQAYATSKGYPDAVISQLTNDLLGITIYLPVKDLATRLNIIVKIDEVKKTTFKEVVEPDMEGLKEIENDIQRGF